MGAKITKDLHIYQHTVDNTNNSHVFHRINTTCGKLNYIYSHILLYDSIHIQFPYLPHFQFKLVL